MRQSSSLSRTWRVRWAASSSLRSAGQVKALRAAVLHGSGRPASTPDEAYAGALRRLDAWRGAAPVDDASLAVYLGAIFEAGRAPATAALAVAAVRFRAKLAGQPAPAGAATARVLGGFRRTVFVKAGTGGRHDINTASIEHHFGMNSRCRVTGSRTVDREHQKAGGVRP